MNGTESFVTLSRLTNEKCPQLNARVDECHEWYETERRNRLLAEWRLTSIKGELEAERARGKKPAAPIVDSDEPPSCGKCYAELENDWKFCPYCGCYIEWDAAETSAQNEADWLYDRWRDEQVFGR